MEKITADLCVIGAGAGGLSVTAVAAQLGLNVVLIERDKMGGDCLNYGCVPSKSLLEAARVANTFRKAELFGIKNSNPEIDIAKVMAHVQGVINVIAEHDSVARFESLGAKIILGSAKFTSKNKIVVDNKEITARRFVIATGSSPSIPPIPGLENAPYFTNETIFSLVDKPQHLIIIGGGPIGCELGQAFLLLGVKVTILENKNIFPHDDSDLVSILRQHLLDQGLMLYESCVTKKIETINQQIQVHCEINGKPKIITGSHLLIATGRRANVKNLNLAAANVEFSDRGINVNAYLQTSNRQIYAIGDASGGYQFTHIANYHAGIVIRNLLFHLPTKVDYRVLPWVTYTNPELAHVGLTEQEARKLRRNIKITSLPLSENDRAQTAHETLGQIKVITDKKGYLLGISILGAHAGELLTPWILAMQNKMKIRSMTDIVIPYPTLSEINKAVANNFYRDLLFSKFTKRLVGILNRF